MIAHLDELDLGCVKVFQASTDAEESIYQMMREYWAHVQELRNRAKNEKLKIAAPLLGLIAEYKNAHFEVYSKWVDQQRLKNPAFESDMTGITKAWVSSFPGQLERILLKLITEYTVFSFYG
jgi:flavorubredoxin